VKKLLALFAAGVVLAATAVAEEPRATAQDAEDLVKTGVAVLKKQGREKAFKEFQNKNGSFIYRDLYLFVYDMKGNCLAHGADPSRVGKNHAEAKDGEGKPFMAERLKLMAAKSSAWQDYKFKNPATGKIEQKTAYLEKVDEMIVGSGAYK
jgi:cytochrome c